jgi:hypothetical protein
MEHSSKEGGLMAMVRIVAGDARERKKKKVSELI